MVQKKMEKAKLRNKGIKVIAISPKYHISDTLPNKIFTFEQKSNGTANIEKVIDYDFDAKILVYEDRVRGWFLDFARKLSKEKHSGFILLMICVSYLEGNQQFREGRESRQRESGEMIKRAMQRMMKIPKEYEKVLDLFISEVRCGLFHDGMTRKHILLKDDISHPLMIDEDKEIVIISPSKLLELVDIDLELYVKQLRNPSNRELRNNFERFWNFRYC